ncbi:DUF418 domain-containing protein [Amycolatopsis cihanbeyliensis]|uniref:DUF418 domain-containing protein n=1 Tax=Amycolatopsis cihanbeyliensis TaxID=1128664 RepID=UPI0011528EE4|nr:DUF418 domain-containing protein [Amycolatopsis cihanbeyliensis]
MNGVSVARGGSVALAPPRGRLTGIDVARGVAVLGMYATHFGPVPREGVAAFFDLFSGRSTALFAVLAGVSIALMAGGDRPKTGSDRRTVAARLAVRAPLLLLLGLLLLELGTGYEMILTYYGVCFLFAIPLLRLPGRQLAVLAVLAATVLPVLSHVLRAMVAPRDLLFNLPDVRLEMFTSLGGISEATGILLLTGTYPAAGLMAFVLAGMAIGRLDLRAHQVRRVLLFGGAGLAAAAYLVSWLGSELLGGSQAVYRSLEAPAAAAGLRPEEYFAAGEWMLFGTTPTTSPAYLLVSRGHSFTPVDLLGCIGVALAVIGGCLLLAERLGGWLRPLRDVGSLALTAYAGHFLVIWLLWRDQSVFSLRSLAGFTGGALLFAVLWRTWFRRGPLEWLLHRASACAVAR